jgi:hypothetical protein
LPISDTGNTVAKPVTALFVVNVRGVDLMPGLLFPKEALAALATTVVVKFHTTGKLNFCPAAIAPFGRSDKRTTKFGSKVCTLTI